MRLAPAIPIIRIFSEDKAREFYPDFLGFTLQWEHRFEPGFPLYAQIRRSDLTLYLSEHHGDATPGSAIFVPVEDIDALQRDLAARHYKYARPGIEELPWGRQIKLADPLATASGSANSLAPERVCGQRLHALLKLLAVPRQAAPGKALPVLSGAHQQTCPHRAGITSRRRPGSAPGLSARSV